MALKLLKSSRFELQFCIYSSMNSSYEWLSSTEQQVLVPLQNVHIRKKMEISDIKKIQNNRYQIS